MKRLMLFDPGANDVKEMISQLNQQRDSGLNDPAFARTRPAWPSHIRGSKISNGQLSRPLTSQRPASAA